jgi:tetratricopeptide (TPR) repeat protein
MPDGAARTELIPGWLALTVLVLLLAVATLGGYVIRGLLVGSSEKSPADIAVSEWQRQVNANPNDPDSLLGLGYAYQQTGDYQRALEAYETVISVDPRNTGALYNTGVVLSLLGRAKDAEVAYWDVLEVAPDHALAAKALGEYYIGRAQYKSALAALEPVIEVRPQYADLQYLAGFACEKLGLTPQSIEYYRGALTYAPDYAEARDGLARLGEKG